MTPRGARHIALALLSACLAARAALADGTTPEQKAAAQVLFEQARALVERGRFSEACPKFAESERLDPGLGTLLWLADCYENTGATASAWASFKEAAAAAALRHDDRERIARDRAAKLEAKLSRLTITVAADASVPGLQIHRDGMAIGNAEWGVPLPVDPGDHNLTASAPGHLGWSSTVRVGPDGDVASIAVPPLTADTIADDAPPAAPATESPPHREVVAVEQRGDPHRGDAERIIGLVVAGAGVAGLAVGTAFSFNAKSTYDASNTDGHCLPDNECDATGKSDRSRASSMATVATAAIAGGAAAAAGGTLLFFLAPRPVPTVAVSPIRSGSTIRVTWDW